MNVYSSDLWSAIKDLRMFSSSNTDPTTDLILKFLDDASSFLPDYYILVVSTADVCDYLKDDDAPDHASGKMISRYHIPFDWISKNLKLIDDDGYFITNWDDRDFVSDFHDLDAQHSSAIKIINLDKKIPFDLKKFTDHVAYWSSKVADYRVTISDLKSKIPAQKSNFGVWSQSGNDLAVARLINYQNRALDTLKQNITQKLPSLYLRWVKICIDIDPQ